MEYLDVVVAVSDRVAVVTINRPERRNALAARTLDELDAAFAALRDGGAAGAVVLTGAGDRAFCAGADLETGFSGGDVKAFVRRGQEVFRRIEYFPAPVVAAVNGYALGGGFELMMCCDIVVAAENAALGQPEVNRGIIPGWGGTQMLPRRVPKQKAMEILMLGGRMRAREAERLGLVNLVTPKGKEMDAAMEIAGRLSRAPQTALRMVKDAVLRGSRLPPDEGLEVEADNFVEAFEKSGIKPK
ncbi:MAG: enoyl-CoA hydratase/isomerase family protein [bacterium]